MPSEDFTYIKENLDNKFINLNDKKILITGGSGFFGKSILSFLRKEINISKIIILSRNPSSIKKYFNLNDFNFEIELIPHDITNEIPIEESVDFIIHAATESSTSLSKDNPLLMRNTIVDGTKNVIEFAVKNNTKRLLFVSSGAVYGKNSNINLGFNENDFNKLDFLDPLNSYSLSKQHAEHLCALYARKYNISFTIARCFAFVGPYLPLNAHCAIGNFIKEAINGNDIIINGDGKTIRSYLFADDLSEWLLTILLRGNDGEAYNVGSKNKISIYNLAKTVSEVLESQSKIQIMGEESDYVDSYFPNTEKIMKNLNVTEKYSLVDAIKITAKHHLQNSV